MTIIAAIKEVMRRANHSMSSREAYAAIAEYDLYEFHTDKPVQIVSSQIRRHCVGLDFATASKTKHFTLTDEGKFFFLKKPIKLQTKSISRATKSKSTHSTIKKISALLDDIKKMHSQHENAVKFQMIESLKELTPSSFEFFSKKLLETYGFKDMVVTALSNDGGIDGYGKLKVGLAFMNVAFQCKRWIRGSVGRPEIDKFRGAIQGKYEQGIFFTTSVFSKNAKNNSFRPGAVPIVLIDGKSIVDMMIEKKFGVLVEDLPIYSSALDLILADENEE